MTPLFSHPEYSSKGNILIADDDDDVCLSLKKFFEEAGYGVYICQSLSDFMELEHDNMRCVILDINLDNNQAFQTIDLIRQSDYEGDIPIILTSDVPSTDLVVRGLNAGADDYLLKPFSTRELMSRVSAIARSRNQGRI